jgi:hypothetical protein
MIPWGAQYMVTHTRQKKWQEYLSNTNAIDFLKLPDDLQAKISYPIRKFYYQFEGDIEQADMENFMRTLVDKLNEDIKLKDIHKTYFPNQNRYNEPLDTLVRSIFDKKFTPDKNDKVNLPEDDWKKIVFHTSSNFHDRIWLESDDKLHKLELKYKFYKSDQRTLLRDKTLVRIRYIGPQSFTMLPNIKKFKNFGSFKIDNYF